MTEYLLAQGITIALLAGFTLVLVRLAARRDRVRAERFDRNRRAARVRFDRETTAWGASVPHLALGEQIANLRARLGGLPPIPDTGVLRTTTDELIVTIRAAARSTPPGTTTTAQNESPERASGESVVVGDKPIPNRDKFRIQKRCQLCGRGRAVYRKFGICRSCFRKMAGQGLIASRSVSVLPSDAAIVWDPKEVSAAEYAELVQALGDLSRAAGGTGVKRGGSDGFEVSLMAKGLPGPGRSPSRTPYGGLPRGSGHSTI
ncbi:MAG: rpsZ [Gemmataceae bacterium]|nr:rpsZ [Gemmataceae bacterium]